MTDTPESGVMTCPHCDVQVALRDGLFPTHQNKAGHRCLGPDVHRATPDHGWVPPSERASEGSSLPAWIARSANLPAAAVVAWGIGAVLVGTLLAWLAFSLHLNDLFTIPSSDYGDDDEGGAVAALLIFSSLTIIVGVIALCTGVTRLVAKADVVFHGRQQREGGVTDAS